MILVRSSCLNVAFSPSLRLTPNLLVENNTISRHRSSPCVVVRAAERDAVAVQSWDIVVLEGLEGSRPSLARVLVAGDKGKHIIELLEEESVGEFAATGVEKEIKAEQIVTVITDFDYKQIQVDRAINPHGEHAEEIFTIPITSLPS